MASATGSGGNLTQRAPRGGGSVCSPATVSRIVLDVLEAPQPYFFAVTGPVSFGNLFDFLISNDVVGVFWWSQALPLNK